MSIKLANYYKREGETNIVIKSALDKISNSRILITGANGVVGYALARLIDSNKSVNLNLAARSNDFYGSEYFSSNTQIVNYKNIYSDKYDYIFHCATHSQPSMFLDDWHGTIKLSTNMLLKLLEITDVKLIFTSSTEIYSGATKDSTENDTGLTTTKHPRAIYIESKRLAEAACIHSGKGSISRIALAAGPYAKISDTRVLYELIRKGRKHKLISLLGGHDSIRQYQYTGSCALRMLVSGVLGKESLYNNAGPYLLTLEELAKSLASSLGVRYIDKNKNEKGDTGAPSSVKISMNLFNKEFPEMHSIDPSFNDFIDWVIQDTQ